MQPTAPNSVLAKIAFWVSLVGWGFFATGILLYLSLVFLQHESVDGMSASPSIAHQITPLIWLLVLGSPYLCLLGALLGIPARKYPLGKKAIFLGGANVVLFGIALAFDFHPQ